MTGSSPDAVRLTGERDLYRGYHIYYDPPPIPVRNFDWHFYHDDYDGAEDSHDNRHGHAASLEACEREIDNQIEDAQ